MKKLSIMLVIGLLSSSVSGETIRVPADYNTIQEGIDAAEEGDTVLVADGIYTGSDNKDLDYSGKAITVMSKNGADYTVIDCENDGRGFYFHNNEGPDARLEGFTISHLRKIFCQHLARLSSPCFFMPAQVPVLLRDS